MVFLQNLILISSFGKLNVILFWQKDGLFVGFVHEFLKPGDVIPISIAGKPILLIKNNKDEITAFHNVCSHRCLKLVNEIKNVGKIIQCPYHSWTYDLDGKLKLLLILVALINIHLKDLTSQIMDLSQFVFIFGMIGFSLI